MRGWRSIKIVIRCRVLKRHRWRYLTTTPEAGKVFVCRDCGTVRGDRCGFITKA